MSQGESTAQATPTTISVELGSRSYDILVGRDIIDRAGMEIARRLPDARIAIVTDETVAAHHLTTLVASLDGAGIRHTRIVITPGEASKSFASLERVVDALLESRIERNDAVLAFGGGVVGDLAGFASGIVLRGTHLIQVPTTLLAQVDSSVGGKTGINTPRGKNLVGVFHQPDLVLADAGILDSLPPRIFNAGYAEVAKYGLIRDAGFFAWLETNWRSVAAGWPEREKAIAVACRGKAEIVSEDEREKGARALLNLGHTFGHALEAVTGYSDRLLHGEAVSIGTVLAFDFSFRLGLSGLEDARRVEAHLGEVGLPTRIGQIEGDLPDAATLMHHIAQDKKVAQGKLTFILTRGIGEAFIARDVPSDEVEAFLEEQLAK
ncbi:MAG: 3-dehydroquinate synthase [Bauldia sp.]|uniref:3-dehydroquinate synthase n=1 Tax=Bauldia sp. TaxID=2575872 RepID=UPI001E180F84|nr:3-dehydroquinate synthase [Bauldia sp.]MCB1497480.1 3-dehydroquinate synthase [Bauldia sp.]